jgi:hypothetical protein
VLRSGPFTVLCDQPQFDAIEADAELPGEVHVVFAVAAAHAARLIDHAGPGRHG